uniref:Uncharacterized protein n=1 Tax=Anguilla anguilla TaxID=7936 RepID=A0A0E9U451_ANGAN
MFRTMTCPTLDNVGMYCNWLFDTQCRLFIRSVNFCR